MFEWKAKTRVGSRTGKVLFKDKPAAGVNLVFLPATEAIPRFPGPMPHIEDGSFVVMTDDEEGRQWVNTGYNDLAARSRSAKCEKGEPIR